MTALASVALSDSPAGAGTNGATTYEADCTSALAGSQAAPFVAGLDITATPDPSPATGGTFGASGTATQTVIGPVVAGLEQALAPTAIGATTNETVGSTDGSATGSFTYTHTFANEAALGRQITGVSWTSGSTTLTAAAGTFTSGDVGAFVAGPSGGGINPASTIASVSTDGSSATLSLATTAAGTSATIGTGMNMTFSDSTFSTGNVFTTAGSPGGTANIGVVGVTGVTVNTNILNIAFGGAEGVGTADCLLTGWQNATTPGPAQDFETSPGLPFGNTTPLVLASSGFVSQPGTTQAITPPAAAFVSLAGPLAVTTTSLPDGTVGQPYSATLAATGGTAPYTWSQTGLPAGLTLDPSTGAISGTPTAAGTSTVMVTVTDAASNTASASLSLTVAPAAPAPLSVATMRLPSCHIGKAYSATLSATGGTAPYSWSTPDPADFPPGISLSPDGTISGTDSTQSGKFSFTVTATDAAGATANATLSISCHGHLGHHLAQDQDAQGDQSNHKGDGGHHAFAAFRAAGEDEQ